jgi:hypothetical protein
VVAVPRLDRPVNAPDSPAVAAVRAMVATLRPRGPSRGADALDGVLAELDEAQRELAAADAAEAERKVECPELTCPCSFVSVTPFEAERQLVAHWQQAHGPAPEWTCPGCGATTRARMADRPPRVWLEGDTVPAGVAVIDEPGVEDGGFWTASDLPGLFDRPVVEVHPPTPGAFAAAVAAERERRAAGDVARG